ncbi:PTS sugar transporter subunit IIA [Lacticaseibacillus nasuensis]|nr:PTS sugar transporter subunit IIA [Lacticaseibacillus nasuensis]
MLGFVVATHGSMSDGIIDAAKLIVGEVQNTATVNLVLGDDIEALNEQISTAITTVDQGEGVIVFVDLFGASPYNQSTIAINALPESQRDRVALITGVNLPMFIEAINQQLIGADLDTAVDNALEQGGEGVTLWANEPPSEDEEDDF